MGNVANEYLNKRRRKKKGKKEKKKLYSCMASQNSEYFTKLHIIPLFELSNYIFGSVWQ